MFGRIDVVHTAAQNRDGPGRQGAFVGGGVDAARHARDDDMAGLTQLQRQAARDPLSAGRGDARADDGDAGRVQQFDPTPGPQDRRGRIQRRQHLGIVGIAQHQQAGADPLTIGQFALDLGDGRGNGGSTGLADQIGQDLQHANGRAVAAQQLGKGDGTDAVGAGEPQPGEPFVRRQAHAFLAPIRGSSPFSSRAMF